MQKQGKSLIRVIKWSELEPILRHIESRLILDQFKSVHPDIYHQMDIDSFISLCDTANIVFLEKIRGTYGKYDVQYDMINTWNTLLEATGWKQKEES